MSDLRIAYNVADIIKVKGNGEGVRIDQEGHEGEQHKNHDGADQESTQSGHCFLKGQIIWL